jgi:hypothetical protein
VDRSKGKETALQVLQSLETTTQIVFWAFLKCENPQNYETKIDYGSLFYYPQTVV